MMKRATLVCAAALLLALVATAGVVAGDAPATDAIAAESPEGFASVDVATFNKSLQCPDAFLVDVRCDLSSRFRSTGTPS